MRNFLEIGEKLRGDKKKYRWQWHHQLYPKMSNEVFLVFTVENVSGCEIYMKMYVVYGMQNVVTKSPVNH